ncbi:MAG: bifunctional helix-turn-helix domain-containing protein/methylated-DNA--[protein]-cysteine S-methyltransferase [Bacteroidia bacterium]
MTNHVVLLSMKYELKLEQLNTYKLIEKALVFINENRKSRPNLDEISNHVNLSSYHFQKLFTEWAGISPKKYLQLLHFQAAKHILRKGDNSLFEVTDEIGLSSSGRLHDLFIKIIGMSPDEYKHGGKNLQIKYMNYSSLFGEVFIASTPKGICKIEFETEGVSSLDKLKFNFPNATFIHEFEAIHQKVLDIISNKNSQNIEQLKVHLKASPFKIQVWESLLNIPFGQVSTYGQIAKQIGNEGSSRAVGTAIGSNPVAYLIPCHRVIRANGELGGYMWGPDKKLSILNWEFCQLNK